MGFFHVSVVPCPVGSSDFIVLIFFLWVCLKEECLYRNRPVSKPELVCIIRDQIANVNKELLARVFDNCVKPLSQCAANEGGNLQDVLYKEPTRCKFGSIVY